MDERTKENTGAISEPKALFAKAKAGDSEAFGALYPLYYTPIFRYLYARTKKRADAEDLAQTVFMKVFGARERIEMGNASPLAYFFVVAKNTLIDLWRKKKHGMIVSDEAVEKMSDSVSDGDRLVREHESKEFLAEALRKLTPDQEEIIALRYMGDLSTKEIKDITGKNEDAIRQLESRALKALRIYCKDKKYF